MKSLNLPVALIALFPTTVGMSRAAISLEHSEAYFQDFDSLPELGLTNHKSTLPDGWTFSESGSNGDSIYTADDGRTTTSNTYSYGNISQSTGSDRAFGGISAYSTVVTIGAAFTNNLGTEEITVTISYTGEEWRLGGETVPRLDFQYSTNATSLTSGAWTDVDSLDFIPPISTGSSGALDGNSDPNRTLIVGTIDSIPIPNLSSFWIRWTFSEPSSYGLGIDDFSIVAVPEPSTLFLTGASITLLFVGRRR